jgi:sialate O-acetylesterase
MSTNVGTIAIIQYLYKKNTMNLCKRLLFCIVLVGLTTMKPANGAITLPSLISDNMVMQQGQPVHIWGKADAGEEITVKILNQTQKTVTDDKGNWQVWLQPMNVSESVIMTVSGKNTIVVNNILIGEVWFAAGQSNMEWNVSQSNNAEEEISSANYSQIRFFDAQRSFSDTAKTDIKGKWEICSSNTVGNITAAGYFFSRGIHKKLKVPIGLIDASWGATRCEAWTPAKTFISDPRLSYWPSNWERYTRNFPKLKEEYLAKLEEWKTKDEADSLHIRKKPAEPKLKTKSEPSVIYNGVVAPVSNYTIRGVIWYQGENNAYKEEAYNYRYLFPSMIDAWRDAWKQGQFPFIFVQLSTLWKHPYWPVLRESQTEALKLKNTAMVVTYDIGDSTNAHYKNKQDLGKRLELAARKLVYGENIESSGPIFRQMIVKGNSLIIWFDHAHGLKSADGKELVGFEIAGENGQLFPAIATIEGETILIRSESVAKPTIARYAFKDVVKGNLINQAGLPAVPFRTDVNELTFQK